MPSRMSASDATIGRRAPAQHPAQHQPRRRRARRRGPGASTGTRDAARSASPPAGRRTRARRRPPSRTGRSTLLSYDGRSSTPAAIDSTVPATPTTVAAVATGTGHASSWASISATQAATCSARGRVGGQVRSCIRTEPMSIDCAGDGPGRVTEDQLGRAAADVDDQHREGRRRAQVADRAVVGQAPPPRPRQHLGPDAEPARALPGELRGVGRVAGGRRRAEPDPGHRVLRRPSRRTRRWRRRRGPAPRRPAARWRRRPGRAARSGSRGRPRRAAPR